jgi:hypothetical protein
MIAEQLALRAYPTQRQRSWSKVSKHRVAEPGIRPTVKITRAHLRKTGVRGRYGLALSGLKEKALLAHDARVRGARDSTGSRDVARPW